MVSYDDIFFISVYENHVTGISDLPLNLSELYVQNSMCTNLIIPQITAENIKLIFFDNSNMLNFPDISQCQQLTSLTLNHSSIRSFLINYDLPNTLINLNLSWNLLSNDLFYFDKVDRTNLKLNINDNHFKYDTIPLKIREKQLILRQGTYVFTQIDYNNVGNENIRNFVYNANIAGNNFAPTIFSSQSVHLSSINKSVVKSVEIIDKWIRFSSPQTIFWRIPWNWRDASSAAAFGPPT